MAQVFEQNGHVIYNSIPHSTAAEILPRQLLLLRLYVYSTCCHSMQN